MQQFSHTMHSLARQLIAFASAKILVRNKILVRIDISYTTGWHPTLLSDNILPLCLHVCFVLFVCHGEISRTMNPTVACLESLESSKLGGVHGLCFVAFGPMV